MNTSIILSPASDELKIRFRLHDWVHYYEKMLYDNALLKRTVEETLDFIMREMTHEQGGFYSFACEVLLKLTAYTDNGKYRDLAEQALALIDDSALRAPLGFSHWLSAAENSQGNAKQVAVAGEAGDENFERMFKVIRAEYRPGVVVAASSYPPPKDAPALLNDRVLVNGKATAYVCEGFVCKYPTNDPEIFTAQLNT